MLVFSAYSQHQADDKLASGSKSYIVRSCLHPSLIEISAQTDNRLLAQELADIREGGDDDDGDNIELDAGKTEFNSLTPFTNSLLDDDDEERKPTAYGSIISWSHTDQVGSLGILCVVLALILVNNRVLSDSKYFCLSSHLLALTDIHSGPPFVPQESTPPKQPDASVVYLNQSHTLSLDRGFPHQPHQTGISRQTHYGRHKARCGWSQTGKRPYANPTKSRR